MASFLQLQKSPTLVTLVTLVFLRSQLARWARRKAAPRRAVSRRPPYSSPRLVLLRLFLRKLNFVN